MIDLEKTKKELEKFGLSKNQAEIYMLLVEHKEMRIQEIVKLAQIPRSSVYECLKGLFQLGIAEEVVEDHYRTIRPYPIGTMRHGIDERIFSLQKLITDLQILEKEIVVAPPETRETTVVRYYKNRSGAQQMFWNSLSAKSITYVYSDWGRGRYLGMKFYERIVELWKEKELREKVIINLTSDALESIRKFNVPGSSISRTRIQDIKVIDEKVFPVRGDTIMYDDIYAQIYLKNVRIHGFEIENPNFVQSQKALFELVWKVAKPVSNFL